MLRFNARELLTTPRLIKLFRQVSLKFEFVLVQNTQERWDQSACDNYVLARFTRSLDERDGNIFLLRRHSDGEIRRQGPGSCRPNRDTGFAGEIAGHDRKLYVNGGVVVAVLVF